VDSNVNEDRNREKQLDESFEAWLDTIEDHFKQKNDMTNVPQDNVFDVAERMDEV